MESRRKKNVSDYDYRRFIFEAIKEGGEFEHTEFRLPPKDDKGVNSDRVEELKLNSNLTLSLKDSYNDDEDDYIHHNTLCLQKVIKTGGDKIVIDYFEDQILMTVNKIPLTDIFIKGVSMIFDVHLKDSDYLKQSKIFRHIIKIKDVDKNTERYEIKFADTNFLFLILWEEVGTFDTNNYYRDPRKLFAYFLSNPYVKESRR